MSNWIDLNSNNTMTQAQLDSRNTALIRSKFSKDREDMINRMLTGTLAGMYSLSDKEQIIVNEYGIWCREVQSQRDQARADTIRLSEVIEYESALLRLEKPILSEGTEDTPEILEERDPDTDEILVEYAPEVKGLAPLPTVITINTEEGEEDIDNPLVVEDELERLHAQEIVDNVTVSTTELFNARNPKEEEVINVSKGD